MFVSSCVDTENHILTFLTPKELCHIALVNKQWKKRASHNYLWSIFFSKKYIPIGRSIKEHYNSRGIISLNALMTKVTDFSKRVKNSENGALFCYFREHTKCYFSAKIMNNNRYDHYHLVERYWFLGDLSIDGRIRDVITIGDNHDYIVHTRLPKDAEIRKKSDAITAIIASAVVDKTSRYKLFNVST